MGKLGTGYGYGYGYGLSPGNEMEITTGAVDTGPEDMTYEDLEPMTYEDGEIMEYEGE